MYSLETPVFLNVAAEPNQMRSKSRHEQAEIIHEMSSFCVFSFHPDESSKKVPFYRTRTFNRLLSSPTKLHFNALCRRHATVKPDLLKYIEESRTTATTDGIHQIPLFQLAGKSWIKKSQRAAVESKGRKHHRLRSSSSVSRVSWWSRPRPLTTGWNSWPK